MSLLVAFGFVKSNHNLLCIEFVFCYVKLPRVMNVLSASSRSSIVAWNINRLQAHWSITLKKMWNVVAWNKFAFKHSDLLYTEKMGQACSPEIDFLSNCVIYYFFSPPFIQVSLMKNQPKVNFLDSWYLIVTSSSMVCPEQSTLNQESQT